MSHKTAVVICTHVNFDGARIYRAPSVPQHEPTVRLACTEEVELNQ